MIRDCNFFGLSKLNVLFSTMKVAHLLYDVAVSALSGYLLSLMYWLAARFRASWHASAVVSRSAPQARPPTRTKGAGPRERGLAAVHTKIGI